MFLRKLRHIFAHTVWPSPLLYPVQINWILALMWRDLLGGCTTLSARLLTWTIGISLKSMKVLCDMLDSVTSWIFATGCDTLRVHPCGVYPPHESAILILGAHQGAIVSTVPSAGFVIPFTDLAWFFRAG